ncbi:unnamed protein product [Rotaria magnacalcarata]
MPDVQLLVIIQCINIYIVFFAASIGTIGNILHIITFTCLKKYHTIPSSIFLVRASFAEQLTTIDLLFPQSIGYATGHDTRVMACLFCKITSVLYTGGGVFTLVCLYLAAIDRYLQTCRSATKRQWMKMKRALLLLCIFTFLSIGLGLPFGIFRDVIPSIEQWIISPVALLVVFGYLTWRNVQQTQQRQATGQSSNNIAQQVTRMILIKTTAIVISVMPSAGICFSIDLEHKTHFYNDNSAITSDQSSKDIRINFFSQQTDAALQRHIRSNGELKQQHKVLLSTLLLEQQLHSTATNEHKRLVKEVTLKIKYYLVHKKNKVSRSSLSTVDFYLNDIIREATSIDENDCVKQGPIGIENLTKEIIAQEILLIRRHRDLEQE